MTSALSCYSLVFCTQSPPTLNLKPFNRLVPKQRFKMEILQGFLALASLPGPEGRILPCADLSGLVEAPSFLHRGQAVPVQGSPVWYFV